MLCRTLLNILVRFRFIGEIWSLLITPIVTLFRLIVYVMPYEVILLLYTIVAGQEERAPIAVNWLRWLTYELLWSVDFRSYRLQLFLLGGISLLASTTSLAGAGTAKHFPLSESGAIGRPYQLRLYQRRLSNHVGVTSCGGSKGARFDCD